jgi:5-methyltetrahydrofolate corrinoid/iron sulfur protein methyltransferase
MEAGLKVHKGRALINSVSLQPDRLAAGLPLVKKYNADVIGLLWGAEGMPRDANERCMHAVDFVYKANEAGIPNESIWIDPILTPVSVEINQVKSCFEFMSMLADIAPGCKSTVGLSNISNGTPSELRPHLNRTCMVMLMKHGLYSAIVDAFDAELIKLARGEMPEVVKMVHRMMDGDEPDPAKLSPKELEHYKTYKVLTGEKLYSHSWLQI